MNAAPLLAELVAPVANMLAAAVAAGGVSSAAAQAGTPEGGGSRSTGVEVCGEGREQGRWPASGATALIYIRRSMAQVREHTESTARRYALAQEAARLGWPASQVGVIDTDLGVSGRSVEGRDGFKGLMARVCLGEIGAIFGLEVSRLARSSADLSRLLEYARLTDTLVIDADGVYDLAEFNDRLLLGLKGTMSEAELHLLAGRLQGCETRRSLSSFLCK